MLIYFPRGNYISLWTPNDIICRVDLRTIQIPSVNAKIFPIKDNYFLKGTTMEFH